MFLHPTQELNIYSTKYLLLAARIAPVMAPLVIEFHGSSFPRTFTRPQSIIEKSPPHTAKLPATVRFYRYLHLYLQNNTHFIQLTYYPAASPYLVQQIQLISLIFWISNLKSLTCKMQTFKNIQLENVVMLVINHDLYNTYSTFLLDRSWNYSCHYFHQQVSHGILFTCAWYDRSQAGT